VLNLQAIDSLKRTQTVLKTNGNLHRYNVASNSEEAMSAFPKDYLSKEIKRLNFEKDLLSVHQSLGLSWDFENDTFVFDLNFPEKPNTRR
jgi:hypothetical protein